MDELQTVSKEFITYFSRNRIDAELAFTRLMPGTQPAKSYPDKVPITEDGSSETDQTSVRMGLHISCLQYFNPSIDLCREKEWNFKNVHRLQAVERSESPTISRWETWPICATSQRHVTYHFWI